MSLPPSCLCISCIRQINHKNNLLKQRSRNYHNMTQLKGGHFEEMTYFRQFQLIFLALRAKIFESAHGFMTSEIACRPTRSTSDNKLFLPKANKDIYTSSLEHSGPSSIRKLDSLYSFKKNFSKYLLINTNCTLSDRPTNVNL